MRTIAPATVRRALERAASAAEAALEAVLRTAAPEMELAALAAPSVVTMPLMHSLLRGSALALSALAELAADAQELEAAAAAQAELAARRAHAAELRLEFSELETLVGPREAALLALALHAIDDAGVHPAELAELVARRRARRSAWDAGAETAGAELEAAAGRFQEL